MAPAVADPLTERVAALEGRIAAACRRADRRRADVRLVAVTKGVDAERVRAAAGAGLSSFGENYAQEWAAKRALLADLPDLEWHFIGRLQRNKAGAIATAALVHSLADAQAGTALDGAGQRHGKPVRALVQVNLAGETSKGGVAPTALAELLRVLRGLQWLRVVGLMTIPPLLPEQRVRELFRELRALRDRQAQPEELLELSMGMSGDFETAIEEGATLIRVGTAIFGPRKGAT